MEFGYVPSESRSGDRCDQIRRAGVFFVLVALRWWQVVLQVMAMKLCISPNKVRKGSFEVELSGQLWLHVALLLLATLPWREWLVEIRSGSFFNKAKSLVFRLSLYDLSPLASGKSLEFDGESVLLCTLEARFGGVFDSALVVLQRRHGRGNEEEEALSVAPRGDCKAADYGVHQRRQDFAAVTFGRSGYSVPWQSHGFFNLQADVPVRRPYLSSAVALYATPSPSGFVPGDGAGGRCVELLLRGGEGPDCIPIFFVQVFFVKFKDLVVIFLFILVLVVICMPTV